MEPRAVPPEYVALALEATLMLEFPVRPAALRECADRISGLLPGLAMELHRKASRATRAEVVVDRLISGRRSVDAG